MIIEKNQRYETISLENIIDFVIGGDWGKDETFEDEEFSLAYCIRGAEFKNWQEDRGQTASIRKLKNRSIETRKLQYGDILLEISGGGPEQPVGRTVLIENQTLQRMSRLPIVCTNFLRLVRITDKLNKKYINQYFEFFYKSGEVAKYQAGSNNLRNLKFDDYKLIEIPIAPLLEQKAIVAKIEQLFSELDNGVANLKTAKAKLKIYRQAVLKKAFEGELTCEWREKQTNLPTADELLEQIKIEQKKWIEEEIKKGSSEAKRLKNKLKKVEIKIPKETIPEIWKWTSFLESAQLVVDCHNKTAPYSNEGTYLVRTSNVRDGKLNLNNDIRFVDEATYEYWSRRCPPMPHDILFTREAPMGEAAIIPENTKVCMGQRMMLVRVFRNLLSEKYLLYSILDSTFQHRFGNSAIGTGVKHLRVGDVENLVFPLCSIEEQNQIVQEIESRLSVCDKIEETIETSLAKSEALRQSILKCAFEGKLLSEQELENIKNHPEYESAQALLKRIKKERTK